MTKVRSFKVRYGNQLRCMSQERAKQPPLDASYTVTKTRRVTPGMKSDNVWDLCFFSREHCQRRNKGMTTLTVDEIPCAVFDNGIHLRRDVVVLLRRPGPNSHDAHAFDFILPGKWSSKVLWCGC